jgi:hypothetical protein
VNPRGRQQLILKCASASRPSGTWSDDDFDVLADGAVVGRIMKTAAAPVGSPWPPDDVKYRSPSAALTHAAASSATAGKAAA